MDILMLNFVTINCISSDCVS